MLFFIATAHAQVPNLPPSCLANPQVAPLVATVEQACAISNQPTGSDLPASLCTNACVSALNPLFSAVVSACQATIDVPGTIGSIQAACRLRWPDSEIGRQGGPLPTSVGSQIPISTGVLPTVSLPTGLPTVSLPTGLPQTTVGVSVAVPRPSVTGNAPFPTISNGAVPDFAIGNLAAAAVLFQLL